MRRAIPKRILSALITAGLLLQMPMAALAAPAQDQTAPAIKYYVQNTDSWRYAEKLPLENAVDAVFYLDSQDEEKVVLPSVADQNAAQNNGILSQFEPSGMRASGQRLTYQSAALYHMYQNDLVGMPTADLHISASQAAELTVTLEAVDAEGVPAVVAQAQVAVDKGEQRLSGISLERAYDDGQGEQPEYVAYRFPGSGSIRVSLSVSDGELTLIQDTGSKVTLPFVDHDENGYTGQVKVGDTTSPATMYWLEDNIYVNYGEDDWITIPADSAYTVTAEGAAKFDAFTFLPEGNAFKDAVVQDYDGTSTHTQPFPTYRHVVLDTVPIEPVADLLYLPTQKTLKYDIFMPTDGSKGDVPLIFYIHGYSGSYSALPAFLSGMLDDGYAVAGIDLRNYPSNYSPDYYHDIKGNIRDVRAHADEYGVDPERFGIYGVSLGGNTALMMLVSGGNEYLEGAVGGNEGVSSRLQAGIAGYAWSDAINFGADQRTDNANDPELLASMISGGDGENAPCAQAIGFSGPGKGYLSLRLYKEAYEAAEADGTLEEFLAEPYTFTIDEAYVEKWFPGQEGAENQFTGSNATVTLGTYTFSHDYMQEKLAYAEVASPLYYISPDDPAIMVFGGYGGKQNIPNTQSTRTLKRLSEMGVPAIMAGNTLGNYGNEEEIQVSMKAYFDQYLMERPGGTRIALTVGSDCAVVNDLEVPVKDALVLDGDQPMISLEWVAGQYGVRYNAGADGVKTIGGALYGTVDYVATLTGATVTAYTGETPVSNTETEPYTTVTLLTSAPADQAAASDVVETDKVSLPGVYEGYYDEEDLYANVVTKSEYIEVPATYPDQVEFPSDPDYVEDPSYNAENGTIKLAVTYVLPSADGVTAAEGTYPVVLEASRGGRTAVDSQFNVEQLVKHGYGWMMLEMRGCGAAFGVNNSFASLENRLDIKYVLENWLAGQDWYDGNAAMWGGSNRGLIQWATASTAPDGLEAISPIVCNPDFYYQDYKNGVSAVPVGSARSGTNLDPVAKSYEEWLQEPGVAFVDADPDGKLAYEAYAYQVTHNKSFTTYLLQPNMTRDQENEYLYGEQVNLTIPPVEYVDEIQESGVEVHQVAGWHDSNVTFQIAAANTWGGHLIIGPWGHGAAIRGTENAYPSSAMDITEEHIRWFDYALKGLENGYEDSPTFYYYVMNAAAGTEWRYSDTFPLDNTVDSVLYLAGEDSGEAVSDTLKLDGPQSNNGKLSLVSPEASSVDYTVDVDIAVEGYSGLDFSTTAEMTPVDERGLTFTSAPLANDTEMVGIPTVDLWISSANSDDADFVVYLEEVKADGTSHMVTSGVARASHRATGANEFWDSTEGLGGRYHTSMTADVEAALAEGLEEPVLLQFQMEAMGYCFSAGSSLRFTVTCANNNSSLFQHQPYYATDANGEYVVDEDGNYVMKSGDELPVITLYQGGDKASFISLPIVENVSNTFNGTVTYADGSYEGPGTMYLFDEHWYLYANGVWEKLSVADGENAYTVRNGAAVFEKAGFTFLPEGSKVIKNGIAQNYKGGEVHVQPFPTYYKLHVDTVTNQTGNTNANALLYLPVSKSLDINLFLPEDADGLVPVILYIHGFGGTNIDLDTNLLSLLDDGYALAGVDLRNYPPNENPLYYQDIKGDIRYLRAHAEEYGLDPERFGIYGSSLGGNTALMMLLSGDDPYLEGNVGGNEGVSSRIQAGIAGYAWSDALYFGYDQRMDNENDPELLASMISGGDGESAPCAQAIDFSGPGKGYLVLRNYLLERQAAEEAGKLDEFLSKDYVLTIDEDYVEKWFPGQTGAQNAFIGSGATVTLGTYVYTHEYLMQKVEDAQKASPMYYASEDDPVIVVYGGFGGKQNITNQQSVRTLSALQDSGVLGFYFGNSVVNWNDQSKYGSPAAIQAAFKAYWDHYLKGEDGSKVSFSDVSSDAWYAEAVDFVSSQGLMEGTGNGLFSPGAATTRATLVTILWRMAGEPQADSEAAFADLEEGQWYTDAMRWAAAEGIMQGDGGYCYPDRILTRQELVTLLNRYDGAAAAEYTLDGFADSEQVAAFAREAMQWAADQGILTGKPGNLLDPFGMASRAEMAAILQRYLA